MTQAPTQKQGVILLSGGIDSATTLVLARDKGVALHALSFQYGQRHHHELTYASILAKHYNLPHTTVTIESALFRNSALTDTRLAVPQPTSVAAIKQQGIPTTYVPARNNLFLAYALAYGESHAISAIFFGANIIDYSGYPDCRPEFIDSWQKTANLATKIGREKPITLHAPLLKMGKRAIIETGLRLGLDYAQTWSCYDPTPDNQPCGRCDSCVLRADAFRELGVTDPLLKR
ncbi:MAG: 7-cyano-7-deazaguanine synthase QueC [Alphaproteobacteria bacterium GM202ARS2]|nr:7-cyano-7-deazaguanine synthase QueC [Alphaproteobacteria bacterium GM202ARS2]